MEASKKGLLDNLNETKNKLAEIESKNETEYGAIIKHAICIYNYLLLINETFPNTQFEQDKICGLVSQSIVM